MKSATTLVARALATHADLYLSLTATVVATTSESQKWFWDVSCVWICVESRVWEEEMGRGSVYVAQIVCISCDERVRLLPLDVLEAIRL
ncbi:hypothetical protein BC835DRAFT_219627 [Cytidiella melzeri]|nr:hypothetical protein BC835DRAFT_219627 [Cytidiella melzeri]